MPHGDHELLASDLLTDCSEFHDTFILAQAAITRMLKLFATRVYYYVLSV